jgi:hypothetical protein
VVNLNNYEYLYGDDGFVLNTDFHGTLPFVDVDSITGLDGAPIRINTSEHQGQDGAFIDAPFMSSRTIVITGTLYADSRDPDTVCNLLKQQYGPADPNGAHSAIRRFYYQHPGQPTKFVNAQGGGCQYSVDTLRRLGQTAIQLTLLCADPYTYDLQIATSDTVQQAGQLNANSDFESGLTPWQAQNSATLKIASRAFSGSYSMQVNGNGTTATPGAVSELFPVTANGKYTANLEAFTVAAYASGVQLAVSWYNSSRTFISTSTSSATATAASTWLAKAFNVTAPGTAAFGQIIVQAVGTPAANIAFNFDVVNLVSNVGLTFPASFSGNIGFGGPIIIAYGATTVYNVGNHTAYPVFIMRGFMGNPIVVSDAQGNRMEFDLSISQQDTLVVDCGKKSILVNGSSRRNSMPGLYWHFVPPGSSNTFYISKGANTTSPGKFHTELYSTYY